MSNNYTHVAFTFDCGSSASADSILKEFRNRLDLYVDVDRFGRVLEFTSEHANIEALALVLLDAMKRMDGVPSPQGFEWAYSSDKHSIGEFGGGAVVIGRGYDDLRYVDTGAWLDEQLAKGESN